MYYTRMRYVLFNTSWFGREKKLLKVSKRINNEKIPNILKCRKNIPNQVFEKYSKFTQVFRKNSKSTQVIKKLLSSSINDF